MRTGAFLVGAGLAAATLVSDVFGTEVLANGLLEPLATRRAEPSVGGLGVAEPALGGGAAVFVIGAFLASIGSETGLFFLCIVKKALLFSLFFKVL